MSTLRIMQLAEIISSNTRILEGYLTQHEIAQPSFSAGSPLQPFQNGSLDVQSAREKVIEATIELRQLLEGPAKLLLPESNFAPLASVHRFNIANRVPIDGQIAFHELAHKCGLLEHDLQRIVRYTAVHHRVFAEPQPGFVAHTAASRLLVGNDKLKDLMALTFEECWPAHTRALDAMAHKSEDPRLTGYTLANNTSLTMFEFLSHHPKRARHFASAMSSTSQASLDALATYFEWENLPQGAVIVDVGGSRGHVSVDLARRFPNTSFIVQDTAEVIEKAQNDVPEDVKGRVKLLTHDIFTPQPDVGAVVYLIRYVLHDWPDRYCIQILENIIPALREGDKIVVHDHVLPEFGTISTLHEMQIRSMDAIMMSLFNSRERAESDWETLFSQAGKGRFVVTVRRVEENPTTGVIIAEWRGDSSLF